MRTQLIASALVIGFLTIGSPLFAHHGGAAYEIGKPLVMKEALVTKYMWANPHTLVFFDAKDEKGNVTHWSAELGSPSAMSLMGWNRTSLKSGDVITVYMFPAKNGNPVGRINKIVLADGTLLRDSQTGADNGGRADNDVK